MQEQYDYLAPTQLLLQKLYIVINYNQGLFHFLLYTYDNCELERGPFNTYEEALEEGLTEAIKFVGSL